MGILVETNECKEKKSKEYEMVRFEFHGGQAGYCGDCSKKLLQSLIGW